MRHAVWLLPLSLLACAPQDDAFDSEDAGLALTGEPGAEFVFNATAAPDAALSWRLLDLPPESSLTELDLEDASTPWPRLIPDVAGVYTLELTACAPQGACSRSTTAAYVGASALDTLRDTQKFTLQPARLINGSDPDDNVAPSAQAQSSSNRLTGCIGLDGSLTEDPDSTQLSYNWTLVTVPNDSMLSRWDITDAKQVQASFAPDMAGLWQVRLRVSDGIATGTVTIPVTTNRACNDYDPDDFTATRRLGVRADQQSEEQD